MATQPIGLIGLGLLGAAIAERLLDSGFAVRGFDIAERRRAILAGIGGEVLDSAAEVARASAPIVLSLPESATVREVLARIDPSFLARRVVLDTTTGPPGDAVRFGRLLEACGGSYLDTTIGGSSDQVRQGEAIVMAGGEAEALERSMPVLRCLGREVFHAGPCGSGSTMKLVTNLVLGLNRAATAEGLAFARLCGLAPDRALEVLLAGPARSVAMERKGGKMVAEEFAPEARLSQHLKDVRLILEESRRREGRLPLSEQHAMLLERAEAAGWGDADNSAVIKAFG